MSTHVPKINLLVLLSTRWKSNSPRQAVVSCRSNYFDVMTAQVDKGIELKHIRETWFNDSFNVIGVTCQQNSMLNSSRAQVGDFADTIYVFTIINYTLCPPGVFMPSFIAK